MMNAKTGSACLKRMAMTCAALATAAAAHGQFIVYVDDDAEANGDGLTWDTALNDLQTALFLSRIVQDDMEIYVGAGLYLPSQTGDQAASFDLDRTSIQSAVSLTIRGGFRGLGGGGDPNDRDLDTFRTVLSGDLDGNDVPRFGNYYDNSFHVLSISDANERSKTWLDGLFIRGGGNGSGSDGAGAQFDLPDDQTLLVTNCIFAENYGTRGGGAWVSGDVQFSNSLFVRNRARDRGGAVYLGENHEQSFINCSFVDNEAEFGSAIYIPSAPGRPLVANCILSDVSGSRVIRGNLVLLYSCTSDFYPGEGNIVADPIFVDRGRGDYRLAAGSPCIDAADARLMPRDLYADHGGDTRIVDDPDSPNAVGSVGAFVDMGAFEYQGCDIDFNGDGQANTIDLLTLLNFLNEGCP